MQMNNEDLKRSEVAILISKWHPDSLILSLSCFLSLGRKEK